MGRYKEVKGDLIALAKEDAFDVIVHGCNCQVMMGAGIAATIKEEFPLAYDMDVAFGTKVLRYNKLGCISEAYIEDYDLYVINAYTQFHGGANLDYAALLMCLQKINHYHAGEDIGLPQIGCGIAGGNWERVKFMIKNELKDCDVTVVIFEP